MQKTKGKKKSQSFILIGLLVVSFIVGIIGILRTIRLEKSIDMSRGLKSMVWGTTIR